MGDLHVRVRQHLDASAATYRLRDHDAMPTEIESPADFAAALGYPLSRIMKTVVCQSLSTETYVAIVCPVDIRIGFKGVARQMNCGRLETASSEGLESATGYPRGGVSPLGLDERVLVAIARQSFDYETVLVGGGALGVEVEIAPWELARVTGATPVDFGIAP